MSDFKHQIFYNEIMDLNLRFETSSRSITLDYSEEFLSYVGCHMLSHDRSKHERTPDCLQQHSSSSVFLVINALFLPFHEAPMKTKMKTLKFKL